MELELWQYEIKKFMEENKLQQNEMVEIINNKGGNINASGFNHWMKNPPRNRPSVINIIAIENILNGKIRFISNTG